MELRMYLEILRRRRLLIVAVTVIVASVAGITSSLKPPVYTATAQVLLRPGDPSEELNPSKAIRPYADPNRYLAAQVNIIKSQNVAKAAARELRLADAGGLLARLSARQAGTTDIIAIAFTDPDPVRASQVANAFAHAYIEDRRSNSVAGLERASREVDAKLIQVERHLVELDKQIAAQTPPSTTTTAPTTTTTLPPTTTTTLPATTTTRQPAQAVTTSQSPAPYPTTTTTAPRPTTTTTKPPPTTTTTKPPPTTTTTAAPPTTTTTTARPTTTTTRPRRQRQEMTFVLISATRSDGVVLGQATSEGGDSLKATRDAAAVQYESLYSRQQELLITTSLKRGEAELIAAAGVPATPSSPKPKRDLALGTVVGLMLGLGLAFLREQLDDRLHSREEVEEATQLPVLCELPLDPETAKRPARLAAHERPTGVLAESARGMRTSLTFMGVDEPIRRLLVTSPGQGDGKSFVAANLAVVYAQAGFRTVLVSADLRRPRLDSLFPDIAPGPGVAEVIAGLAADPPSTNGHGEAAPSTNGQGEGAPSTNGHGEAAPADAVLALALRPTQVDGLALLPAGKLPPNPAELLGSRRATALWESLSRLADVVILDSPPVLAVTDAAVLAPEVDGVILVAAPGRTHRGALARTAATLSGSGARLVGVVLNQVEGKGHPYAYSHYYGTYSRPYTDTSDKRSRLPWRRRGGAVAETESGSEAESDARAEVGAE